MDRFANLETGQSSTVDAALVLDLLTDCASSCLPPEGASVLDIGCGAGNFSLLLFRKRTYSSLTLLDLSGPMLDRAVERLRAAGLTRIERIQADIRETDFPPESFDAILATAVLHHLREDHEWEGVFAKLHRWLKPGGAVWIFDLVRHEIPEVQEILWERYRDYLVGLGGEEYRRKVLAYIHVEDSPRTLTEQLGWLGKAGFDRTEVLHKNGCFAAFAGFHRGKP